MIKNDFIKFLLNSKVIRFGDFTTKSGRKTPYFVNTGDFKTGQQMSTLSSWYAQVMQERFAKATNLYGPAYKGIPLVAGVSSALWNDFKVDLTYTFNRKEAKDHGEGGLLVGDAYPESQEVVVIEDVITAGTSLKETLELLKSYPNAKVKGLLVAVDRQERMESGLSALQEVQQQFGVQVESICCVEDIIHFLKTSDELESFGITEDTLQKMLDYRAQYGA